MLAREREPLTCRSRGTAHLVHQAARAVGEAFDHPARARGDRALDQRLRLVAPAEPDQPLGGIAQEERAISAEQSQRAACLDALERHVEGILDPSGLVDAVGEVDERAGDVVGLLQLDGDGQRVAQGGLAARAVAGIRQAEPERVERVALLRARSDAARDGQRLATARGRLVPVAAQHQELPVGGDDPRALGARRLRGQQVDRGAVAGVRLVAAPRDPEVAPEALLDERRADGVAHGVELGGRGLHQRDRAVVLRAQVGRVRCPPQHVDAVAPGQRSRHPRPGPTGRARSRTGAAPPGTRRSARPRGPPRRTRRAPRRAGGRTTSDAPARPPPSRRRRRPARGARPARAPARRGPGCARPASDPRRRPRGGARAGTRRRRRRARARGG